MGAAVLSERSGAGNLHGKYENQFPEKVDEMNTIRRISLGVVVTTALLGLGACADMSRQDKNTAIGAGAGAVGGAVLTGGSAAGTAAGAVVGGVIGHEVKKD